MNRPDAGPATCRPLPPFKLGRSSHGDRDREEAQARDGEGPGYLPAGAEINGTPYRVSPIPVRDFGARKAYRLKRDAATIHHVIEHIHGVECSCGDFLFRHDGRDVVGCKHVRALKAVGLL